MHGRSCPLGTSWSTIWWQLAILMIVPAAGMCINQDHLCLKNTPSFHCSTHWSHVSTIGQVVSRVVVLLVVAQPTRLLPGCSSSMPTYSFQGHHWRVIHITSLHSPLARNSHLTPYNCKRVGSIWLFCEGPFSFSIDLTHMCRS